MKFSLMHENEIKKSKFEAACLICHPNKKKNLRLFGKKISGKIAQSFKSFADKTNTLNVDTVVEGKVNCLMCPLPKKPGLDNQEQFRIGANTLFQRLNAISAKTAVIPVSHLSLEEFLSLVEGFDISSYTFQNYKSKPKKRKPLNIVFSCSQEKKKDWAEALKQTLCITKSINICRDLVNEPGENLTPESYAKRVKDLISNQDIKVRIRNEKELIKEGFNGLITVGKGSQIPPKMMTLSYKNNSSKKSPHLVLLGKGVTFDTGGISLKPSSSMWEMKCDMAGSATVLGAMLAISQLNLKVNVTTILVLAENRPGLSAVLPGDIFTAKNGKTVMVENTDAEGRLILTDGLAEAGMIKGSHVIDLATLTGAIVRALGTSMAGLFSNDDEFGNLIKENGLKVSEKMWAMPLEDEYKAQLEDSVADLKNIGQPEAGAISAALFLREFVPKNMKWAHIDIAGTAFITSPWKYYKPGATGWGVKALVEVVKALNSKN